MPVGFISVFSSLAKANSVVQTFNKDKVKKLIWFFFHKNWKGNLKVAKCHGIWEKGLWAKIF